jgi:hypothetical protein
MDNKGPFPFLNLPKDMRFVCFSMLIYTRNHTTILNSIKELGRLRSLNKELYYDLISHASNNSDIVDIP